MIIQTAVLKSLRFHGMRDCVIDVIGSLLVSKGLFFKLGTMQHSSPKVGSTSRKTGNIYCISGCWEVDLPLVLS